MIYLAWSAHEADVSEGPWSDVFSLAPGLWLIESTAGRSQVYHAIKDTLPRGTALLVAALPEQAKFKGMAPGASTWLRSHG